MNCNHCKKYPKTSNLRECDNCEKQFCKNCVETCVDCSKVNCKECYRKNEHDWHNPKKRYVIGLICYDCLIDGYCNYHEFKNLIAENAKIKKKRINDKKKGLDKLCLQSIIGKGCF